MKLDHVAIMTKDMGKSITFYEEIIGMKVKEKIYQKDEKSLLAFLCFQDSDETVIELVEDQGEFPNEGKVNHVAIVVDDIQACFNDMKNKNANFMEEEISTLPNGFQYFFIYGPENEKIEFMEK